MEQYVGKKVILRVDVGGAVLAYNAFITKVDNTHIHFTDKYNETFSYRIQDILEIRLRKDGN